MASKGGLAIASFDGGGPRSFSQLEIMRAIMHRLKWEKYSTEVDKVMLPCEHFDLIGGSGTGGLIAILFARLRMSVEEASDEFFTIVEEVYKPDHLSPAERTQKLREFMEAAVQRKGLPGDPTLMGENTGCCACFVIARPRINAATKICFRSYPVPTQLPSSITIVEAAIATCAAQPVFAPVSSGSGYRKREYIGAGVGANNPVRELITEAHSLFGGESRVACLLSLGTGHPGIISIPSERDINLHRLRDMMNDCEQRAQEMEQQIGRAGIYFRFSVEQGMQNEYPGQAADPNWILAQTESYLVDHATSEKLGALVRNINSPSIYSTLDQLKYAGGAGVSLQSNATLEMMFNVTSSNHDDAILAKLKPGDLECGSRVAECMRGTRRDIFARINDWVADPGAPNILWMKGHPGIGKSAIASSLVEQLRLSKRLGSRFFFQRERATVMTPNALWRVVAYDLARQYPSIRKHIVGVLEADETIISTVNIDNLFRQLIQDSLLASEIPAERVPVIVIDALDECGGVDGPRSEDRKSLMRTVESSSCLFGRAKLIITSRGEHDIERLFSRTRHQPVELYAGQDVNSQSLDDIRIFLEDQFRQVAAQYTKSLPPDWPGNEKIMELTRKASGLFIWAKTVVGFVTRGEPDEQLSKILWGTNPGGMGSLYSWILNTSFPSPSEKFIDSFHSVLGGIILAKTPLDTSSVEHLLSIGGSTIEHICNGLRSVMNSQEPLRINYQSFVDFLSDQEKCPRDFFIDKKRQSRNLTLACLHAMRRNLRFNICGLRSSYLRNADVPDLESRIKEYIPPYLSYSCLFWASHLTETIFDDEIFDHLQYFMDSQFLFWLEVLSLTNQVKLGPGMLRLLTKWIQTCGQDDAMAVDMQRFTSAFASVILQSAPHIYLSSLPFSPHNSAVSKRYMGIYPLTLTVRSGGQSDWPVVQNILSGHSEAVTSVVFSADGGHIVSGAHDGMTRVWNAETGEMVASSYAGHQSPVSSVALSPDGSRFASGSGDCTIWVWDSESSETVVAPLKGHTGDIHSVAFSPDGSLIISGSHDRTIRVWDAETGEMVTGPLEGHKSSVYSVAFSPNGDRIASGSGDCTVRVWDAQTGEMILGPFEGHTDWVRSVVFSPDGQLIISASNDKTIRIWDATTGEMATGPFVGHESSVYSVAFSPDGKCFISGSDDQTVRMWSVETGGMVAGPFIGHGSSVHSVAFSPDGRRFASGSGDCTIRVWDSEVHEAIPGPFEADNSGFSSIKSSTDGGPIASVSDDSIIQSRDVEKVGSPEQTRFVSYFGDSSKMQGDWIIGQNSELLFWVPPWIRTGLWRPSDTSFTGRSTTTLDLKNFAHGESWSLCKI